MIIDQQKIKTLQEDNKQLLEALRLANAALSGANMNMSVVQKKIQAAINLSREA